MIGVWLIDRGQSSVQFPRSANRRHSPRPLNWGTVTALLAIAGATPAAYTCGDTKRDLGWLLCVTLFA